MIHYDTVMKRDEGHIQLILVFRREGKFPCGAQDDDFSLTSNFDSRIKLGVLMADDINHSFLHDARCNNRQQQSTKMR